MVDASPRVRIRGFGNEHATEAIPGALPAGQNNPQRCPLNLYAEQISGTAFTAARTSNQRTWLYRLHPSADHHEFEPLEHGKSPPSSLLPLAASHLPRSKPTPENSLFTVSRSLARERACVLSLSGGVIASFSHLKCNPNQLRWNPMPIPETPTDFVSGSLSLSLSLSLWLVRSLASLARALSLM